MTYFQEQTFILKSLLWKFFMAKIRQQSRRNSYAKDDSKRSQNFDKTEAEKSFLVIASHSFFHSSRNFQKIQTMYLSTTYYHFFFERAIYDIKDVSEVKMPKIMYTNQQ